MSVLALVLGLLGPVAWAEGGVGVVAAGAVETLPQADGELWARSRYRLTLRAPLVAGLSLTADGDLRQVLVGDDGGLQVDESDLHRLMLGWRAGAVRLSAGRFVHLGGAGLVRVDGLGVDVDRDGLLGGSLWAGRVGHAEAMELPGDLGLGAELRRRPGAVGVTGGYDLRWGLEGYRHRFSAGATVQTMGGVKLLSRGELGLTDDEDAEPGVRAELAATVPAHERVQVSLGARWLGLQPATMPWSAVSMAAALAPEGYGVADAGVELSAGRAGTVRLSGGPTFLPDDDAPWETGGTGQLAWGWRSLGLHGLGTTLGESWTLGGGAGAGHRIGPVALSGEAGLYRHQGWVTDAAWVGEGRAQAAVALLPRARRSELDLVVRSAAGTDGALPRWYRAGVAVQGRVGGLR